MGSIVAPQVRATVRGAARWLVALTVVGCTACHTNSDREAPASAKATAAPAARAQPDVIIITVDTLRPDHLGAYGYAAARTPRIDGLATEGVRFDWATSSLPRTTPALASLLTGLEPRHHGSREVGMKLKRGTSLATVLEGAGYTAIGVSGTPVAGPKQKLDRGFSKFQVLPLAAAKPITEWALQQVDAVPAERPLLLWVHLVDPHFDYRPPEGGPQPAAPACRALMERLDRGELDRGAVYANEGGVAAAALADCRALYDAEIAYSDLWIGRLLDGLRERGRLARAHVLFSADHGEHLGERELYYEHGPTVHDADLRIPLLWSGPGVARGRVDAQPARLEDIAPTLLSLLGIAPAEPLDGRDLRARLDPSGAPPIDPEAVALAESGSALQPQLHRFISSGRANKLHCTNGPRYSLCQSGEDKPQLFDREADPKMERDVSAQKAAVLRAFEAARARWPAETAREYAARGVRFKLVRLPRFEGGYASALYDLQSDPAETTDVSARFPDELARLERALSGWIDPAQMQAPAEPDRATQEALRALGYAQ